MDILGGHNLFMVDTLLDFGKGLKAIASLSEKETNPDQSGVVIVSHLVQSLIQLYKKGPSAKYLQQPLSMEAIRNLYRELIVQRSTRYTRLEDTIMGWQQKPLVAKFADGMLMPVVTKAVAFALARVIEIEASETIIHKLSFGNFTVKPLTSFLSLEYCRQTVLECVGSQLLAMRRGFSSFGSYQHLLVIDIETHALNHSQIMQVALVAFACNRQNGSSESKHPNGANFFSFQFSNVFSVNFVVEDYQHLSNAGIMFRRMRTA